MKYYLIGTKSCQITNRVRSTITLSFDSYTEARMRQVSLELDHKDMKFKIDFNTDYVSLDSLLSIINPEVKPSNFN